MKKIIVAIGILFIFASCTKETTEPQRQTQNVMFQIESEDLDGKTLKSEILIVKL